MRSRRIAPVVLALTVFTGVSRLAPGAGAAEAPRPSGHSFVELGAGSQNLTGGFPNGGTVYTRGVWQRNAKDVWNAEVARQEQFDDSGTLYVLGNTRELSPDWFTRLGVGSSSGGFFLPSLQVEGAVNRKWGRRRDLITTAGVAWIDAKDAHRDMALFLGATRYFSSPWIVEGGVRWNWSDPGSVGSRSQFLAITHGRHGKQYLTLRVGSGREAYQLIGPAATLTDFGSREVSLTWRRWVTPEWGFHLTGSQYRNPHYRRQGVSLGTFRAF